MINHFKMLEKNELYKLIFINEYCDSNTNLVDNLHYDLVSVPLSFTNCLKNCQKNDSKYIKFKKYISVRIT